MRNILYTTSLGRTVSQAAKKSKMDTVHVIPQIEGRWAVVADGSTKAVKVFDRKAAAVAYAKNYILLKKGTLVVIHDRDGRITSKQTQYVGLTQKAG